MEKTLRVPFATGALSPVAQAALLAAIVLVLGGAVGTFGSAATTSTVINLLVMIVAVVALSTFSGNSGILSFGHAAFMALGAQISATLTVEPRLKTRLLPDLGSFLQSIQLDFWTATIITIVIVMLVALVIGTGCPSSGDLGLERLISNGGPGSLGFQSMPLFGDAASGGSRWSWL